MQGTTLGHLYKIAPFFREVVLTQIELVLYELPPSLLVFCVTKPEIQILNLFSLGRGACYSRLSQYEVYSFREVECNVRISGSFVPCFWSPFCRLFPRLAPPRNRAAVSPAR